jgi:hypothetical protein
MRSWPTTTKLRGTKGPDGTCVGPEVKYGHRTPGGGAGPLRMPSASCHEPYKRLSSGVPNNPSSGVANAPESVVALPCRPMDQGRPADLCDHRPIAHHAAAPTTVNSCADAGDWPAAALLVGYVSIELCALLAPCRRPIFNATTSPLYVRRHTSICGSR